MEAKIVIEVSARHVHVTVEDLEVLFGKGYILTKKKDLLQPGEFAAEERVTIVGPRRNLENVSILGPVRKQTQVEISLSDSRSLGITAFVRDSGELDGTAGCRLVGPNGEVELKQGVIAAKRHIHMTEVDATTLGVSNKQTVKFAINTDTRSLVFDDVVVRVSNNYALAMHIDTDEGNAAGLSNEVTYGNIVK